MAGPATVTGVVMPGARKAAVLALLLGEEQMSLIFKHLREDEIEKVTKEVAALGSVQPDIGERVLEEFHLMSKAAGYIARGGVEFAKALLLKSLGPETARRILDRVIRSFESTAGFSALEKADPQQLSKFILGEHPQTIALILAHLNASNAATSATVSCLGDSVEPNAPLADRSTSSMTVISRSSVKTFT